MKNHFYMAYWGNKREEVERIYETLNLDGIDTVVEPFAGTSAISYYIWTKRPDLTFVLNDSDKNLFKMFNILRDDKAIEAFEAKYKSYFEGIDKVKYNEIIKTDDVEAWYLKNKFYSIRPGLYPTTKVVKTEINLKACPIAKFYREAKISFTCGDAIAVIDEYKDKANCALILDPPYINTSNEFYRYDDFKKSVNIYEYLALNDIKKFKAYFMAILENNWIIKLLFRDNTIVEYSKMYQTSKKKTTHFVITK